MASNDANHTIDTEPPIKRKLMDDAIRRPGHLSRSAIMRVLLLTVLVLWIFERASAEDAAVTARIPYVAFRDVLASNPAKASGHLGTHVQAVPHVRSELEGVTPEEIELTLTLGDDRMRLEVSPDGSFQLPADKKWINSEAFILTNQPKGTLVISVRGRMSLGRIAAKRVGNSSVIEVSHMFPSKTIRETISSTVSETLAKSPSKVSVPLFEVVQFRHDPDVPLKATMISSEEESQVEIRPTGVITFRRVKVTSSNAAQLHLYPVDGWSWRAKREGKPWETWVAVSVLEEQAEQ